MTDADRGQVPRSAAEVYEEFFVPALFGQWPTPVLEAADVGVGDRVLDVGCGTGVLARAAAQRVGPAGHVVGLDLNDGMLSVARSLAPIVTWREGAAERLPFGEASFDRVVSQFALMFFTDRAAALSEMSRVLAPGGRVVVATWASLEQSPGYSTMVELVRDVCNEAAADALRAPFVLGDADDLAELMAGVFDRPVVRRQLGVASFESIDAWVHTEVRGWTLTDLIDDDQYALLLETARRRLRRFADDRGRVSFPAPALIATARVSSSSVG